MALFNIMLKFPQRKVATSCLITAFALVSIIVRFLIFSKSIFTGNQVHQTQYCPLYLLTIMLKRLFTYCQLHFKTFPSPPYPLQTKDLNCSL